MLLGPSGMPMLGSQRMSRRLRAAFCILLGACILLGPAVAPSYVLCAEEAGYVHVEPVNATCCGRHFDPQEGLGLVHDCGDCIDTALSASLHRANSHSSFRAFPTVAFIISILPTRAFDASSRCSQPPLQMARPPSIVLLC
jgi:hypothetical protein